MSWIAAVCIILVGIVIGAVGGVYAVIWTLCEGIRQR